MDAHYPTLNFIKSCPAIFNFFCSFPNHDQRERTSFSTMTKIWEAILGCDCHTLNYRRKSDARYVPVKHEHTSSRRNSASFPLRQKLYRHACLSGSSNSKTQKIMSLRFLGSNEMRNHLILIAPRFIHKCHKCIYEVNDISLFSSAASSHFHHPLLLPA